MCFHVKTQNACACMSPHVATRVSFVAILLLQTYGHYPSSTCFHTLSVAYLNIPDNIWIIICLMRQESNV